MAYIALRDLILEDAEGFMLIRTYRLKTGT
jgi:hypothetical protein